MLIWCPAVKANNANWALTDHSDAWLLSQCKRIKVAFRNFQWSQNLTRLPWTIACRKYYFNLIGGPDMFGPLSVQLRHQDLGNYKSHIDAYIFMLQIEKWGSLRQIYQEASKTTTLSSFYHQYGLNSTLLYCSIWSRNLFPFAICWLWIVFATAHSLDHTPDTQAFP